MEGVEDIVEVVASAAGAEVDFAATRRQRVLLMSSSFMWAAYPGTSVNYAGDL